MTEGADPPTPAAVTRQQFFIACALGALAAGLVFLWMLVEGRLGRFFDRVELGNFYEAQARSWLHLRWSIPRRDLSAEAFFINGRTFTYFGPWPAVLRLPVVMFTHALDGRLARLSMLVAFTVAMVFTARLAWRARTVVRGDGPASRLELVGTGAFVAVVGCGSPILFLAGRAWVFHEASLWGVALALAGLEFVLAFLCDGRRRDLVLAGAAATLAFLSRPTVGAAPLLALGGVLAAMLAGRAISGWQTRRDGREPLPTAPRPGWLGLGDTRLGGSAWAMAVATVVPVVLYAYVNYSRFRSLFGVPIDRQLLLNNDPFRHAALAANNGNLTGFKFAPTTTLAYWRPDGIGFDRLFPWFTFPKPPHVVGSEVFDTLDPTASVPATAVLLVALALAGIVAIVLTTRVLPDAPRAALFRVPLLAAAVASGVALPFGYVAQRYEADAAPFLVLAAVIGLQWVARLVGGTGRRRARATVLMLGAVLACWSVAAVFGVTLQYQRMYASALTTETRSAFVSTQLDIHDAIPGGNVSHVEQGDALPLVAPAGTFFIVRDCAGLYWSDGKAWRPIDETPATGRFRLRVDFPRRPAGTVEPLLTASRDNATSALLVRSLGDDRVRFEYQYASRVYPGRFSSSPLRITPGRAVDVTLRFDPVDRFVEVRVGGDRFWAVDYTVANGPATVGAGPNPGPAGGRFSGTIHTLPARTPRCDRLEPSAVR